MNNIEVAKFNIKTAQILLDYSDSIRNKMSSTHGSEFKELSENHDTIMYIIKRINSVTYYMQDLL